MAWETIIVERAPEGFATLAFNRPDKLNVLSIRMRQEMSDAITELAADPGVRVLILTGTGRAFTVGLDLDEWAAAGMVAAGAYEHDAVAALQRFPGPVIGAINGLALTGGVEIALACDVLIASSDARFADTHAQVGLLPGWGGSVRMARRIGLHRAKELALTGRFLDAQEALAWGFVNRVAAPGMLRADAEAMARQMLACVPETLVAYKQLLDAESQVSFEEALRLERAASKSTNVPVTQGRILEKLSALRSSRGDRKRPKG